MPGPAIAAIAGGLGSALIGANASNKAAQAQSDASADQLRVQADMFNRTDALQGQMYRDQARTIKKGTQQTTNVANALRDVGLSEAQKAYLNNQRQNTNALNVGIRDAANNRDATIQDARQAFVSGRGRAGRTALANIGDLRSEMGAGSRRLTNARNTNVRDYQSAERASLGYFEPSIGRGNDAGAAYAYNLGLGGKPGNYTGLQESEGTKYLMKTGRQEIEGGAAGQGNLNSGATLAALEEKRQGLASLDKDNQMAQMLALAGLGQSAANSAAGVRSDYTGKIAGERTGAANSINALRGTYTGQINNERSDFRDVVNGLDATKTSNIIGSRNLANMTANGMREATTARGIGINNANYANVYGVNADNANALTNAINLRTSNLGTARTNRANLYGSAAMNYANGASNAYGAMGDARAAGAIGSANALLGGINNGIGIYGMMGGSFGGGAKTPTVPSNGTNPFSGGNPFANWKSWF